MHRILATTLVAGALAIAGCSSSGSAGSAAGPYGGSSSGNSATSAPATSTSGSTTSKSTMGAVGVSHDGKLGDHLVAGDGRTLYLFEADHGTSSACSGACKATWPAYTADAPKAASGVDRTKLTTANGSAPHQVVYGGHLLYEFAGDKAAGDVNGVSIPDWYAVSPGGKAIETH